MPIIQANCQQDDRENSSHDFGKDLIPRSPKPVWPMRTVPLLAQSDPDADYQRCGYAEAYCANSSLASVGSRKLDMYGRTGHQPTRIITASEIPQDRSVATG